MNEKMSPELLEHHMEFVDVMLEQLKELEVMIGQATSKTDIRVAAHLMEMDRIKYVISDYLRCRLRKVKSFKSWLSKLAHKCEQLSCQLITLCFLFVCFSFCI